MTQLREANREKLDAGYLRHVQRRTRAQGARSTIVSFDWTNAEEVIWRLTDLFGADQVAKIAHEHEQKKEAAADQGAKDKEEGR